MVMYHVSEALMKQLLAGSEEAFGVWYNETVDDFARYVAVRYDLTPAQLEDTIAQFYMRMWDVFPTLDSLSESRLYVYSWTVLNNLVKDFFKKKKSQTFSDFQIDDEDEGLVLVSEEDVAELFAQQYAVDTIMQALRDLDGPLYDIFYLKYMEWYTYEEVAYQLDMSYDAVRKQHSRAIRSLQSAFGSHYS